MVKAFLSLPFLGSPRTHVSDGKLFAGYLFFPTVFVAFFSQKSRAPFSSGPTLKKLHRSPTVTRNASVTSVKGVGVR